MTDRRQFLKAGLASGLALSTFVPASVRAQSGSYKALVCIMLNGGLDAHDTIVPTNKSGYETWAKHRSAILNGAPGGSRDRSAILAMEGEGFGFVPQMKPLADLYNRGRLAVVANSGPLEEMAVRRQVVDKTVRVPVRLASHNDQRSMWVTNGPDGSPTGWGGRMLDAFGNRSDLSRISFVSNVPMVAGKSSPGVTLNPRAIRMPFAAGDDKKFRSTVLPDIIEEHYREAGSTSDNLLVRAMADAQRRNVEASRVLKDAAENQAAGDVARINGNPLAAQLAIVANIIAANATVGVDRQIFFVQLGGFDTHANHFPRMPQLQKQLADAMSAFQRSIDQIGRSADVTTFTVSDFGRTLVSNASGTDHGWGGHHFVMGGAVSGGRVVGEIPPYDVGHDQDWTRGATIPTIAVEQYAAELGSWFGLSDSQLRSVFPKLSRFDQDAVRLFGRSSTSRSRMIQRLR